MFKKGREIFVKIREILITKISQLFYIFIRISHISLDLFETYLSAFPLKSKVVVLTRVELTLRDSCIKLKFQKDLLGIRTLWPKAYGY